MVSLRFVVPFGHTRRTTSKVAPRAFNPDAIDAITPYMFFTRRVLLALLGLLVACNDKPTPPTTVVEGAAAPDVTLKLHDGKSVQLASLRGSHHVLLYFYPKDDTPG